VARLPEERVRRLEAREEHLQGERRRRDDRTGRPHQSGIATSNSEGLLLTGLREHIFTAVCYEIARAVIPCAWSASRFSPTPEAMDERSQRNAIKEDPGGQCNSYLSRPFG
jgi:hypothetical protein